MPQKINIIVENKLNKAKRGITIYHHGSKSGHIISHGSAITIPLSTKEEKDYLHISVLSGPGQLWQDCCFDLPAWVDFECTADVKIKMTHHGERTLVILPPGPPVWQLKITLPASTRLQPGTVTERITIGNLPGIP